MKQELKSLKRHVIIQDLIIICFLGTLLNVIVLITNDHKMPIYLKGENIDSVTKQIYESKGYLPFSDFKEVKHPYLSDIIIINPFFKVIMYVSIGDIMIACALAIIIFLYIKSIIWRK
jgi:hypothetical protein